MGQPNQKQIQEVIRLVKDPNFAMPIFNYDSFDTFHVEMTKNELLQTAYWLEYNGYIERRPVMANNPKRYYLTEVGKLLERSIHE